MQLQLILTTSTKQCSKCQTTKPLTEFHKNRGSRDGLFHWCKECAKANAKRRWEEFPEVREAHKRVERRYKARLSGKEAPFEPSTVYRLPDDYRPTKRQTNKRRTLETALFLRSIKTSVGCQVCGERDADLIDFHHKDPAQKAFALSQRTSRNVSNADRILEEVRKCICLCANCHRRHHLGKMDVSHLPTISDFDILESFKTTQNDT